MKAKYQTRKKFKNADDTFVYNTAKYCKMLAKKYGKNTSEVENYFHKFFEFLDSKGLLTDVVKRRINENIKTMYFDKLPNSEQNLFGRYNFKDNSIEIKNTKMNNRMKTVFHEFIHLLTASYNKTDKKHIKLAYASDKEKSCNYILKIGFCRNEAIAYDFKLNSSLKKYDIDSFVDYLKENSFNDELIIFILSRFYNFNNSLKNSKNIGYSLNEYVALIKNGKEDNKKFLKDSFILNDDEKLFEIKLKNNVFYVTSTQRELKNIEEYNMQEVNRFLTERITEFLARLFMADFTKQRYLGFDGYNLEVKYCEMMYKIFGDKLLEAFFEQDSEKLANMMQITLDNKIAEDKSVYLENFETFTKWLEMVFTAFEFDPISNHKKQFKLEKECQQQIINKKEIAKLNVLTVLENCFVNKLTSEIFANLDQYQSADEIINALKLSVLEFSKSFYFGDGIASEGYYSKTPETERLETLYSCAQIFKAALYQIKQNYETYKNLEIFNEEDVEKLEKLPSVQYDEQGNEIDCEETNLINEVVKDLHSWCVKLNENAYYFTDADICEIHPLDYLQGRTINLFDEHKQDYIRNKTKIYSNRSKKFPTMKKFRKIQDDLSF